MYCQFFLHTRNDVKAGSVVLLIPSNSHDFEKSLIAVGWHVSPELYGRETFSFCLLHFAESNYMKHC